MNYVKMNYQISFYNVKAIVSSSITQNVQMKRKLLTTSVFYSAPLHGHVSIFIPLCRKGSDLPSAGNLQFLLLLLGTECFQGISPMLAQQWHAHPFKTAQIFSCSLRLCANGANDHPVIICMGICVWQIRYLCKELEFTLWEDYFT